jgi:hypothetical protein
MLEEDQDIGPNEVGTTTRSRPTDGLPGRRQRPKGGEHGQGGRDPATGSCLAYFGLEKSDGLPGNGPGPPGKCFVTEAVTGPYTDRYHEDA